MGLFEPKKCFLIDGHNRLYKAFHAIPGLSSPDGTPTNGVYGFLGSLLKLIRTEKPAYLACTFDTRKPTHRHERYADYKATRKPPPSALIEQLPLLREVLAALKITTIEAEGWEADDLMGTAARAWTSERGSNVQVYLVTSDKDCKQLLSDSVSIYDLDAGKPYGPRDLEAETGLKPEQMIDLLALCGDSSDNIPGVPQVGERTAVPLLQRFGSLDGILEHVEEIPGLPELTGVRGREALAVRIQQNADQAKLSQELATIRLDAPLSASLEDCKFPRDFAATLDRDVVLPMFGRLGFTNYIRDLGLVAKPGEGDAGGLDVRLVDTPALLADFVKTLSARATEAHAKREPAFAFDTETTSQNPQEAKLVGLSFAWEDGIGWYIPVRGPRDANVLPVDDVLAGLKPLLEDAAVGKVGHNLKYDATVLAHHGVTLRGLAVARASRPCPPSANPNTAGNAQADPHASDSRNAKVDQASSDGSTGEMPVLPTGADTMVAAYLLNPGRGDLSLDRLALEYLFRETMPLAALIGTGGKGHPRRALDQVPTADVARYAAEDADVTWQLQRLLTAKLEETGANALARDIEYPLVEVLTEMELRGITVDVGVLKRLSTELMDREEELERACYNAAGRGFNLRSTKQLATVLFEERGLPVIKRTKSGPSTDEDVLDQLAKEHDDPLPRAILNYREIQKLRSTYVDTLPGMVNPATGRIHTTFGQCVTATGRLASFDPNLQNIPIRTELGQRIREAFVPSGPDRVLLTLDYSQIELRILAHVCGDEALIQAFKDDLDIHQAVAAQVAGIKPDKVTPAQRSAAKAVNFGIVYGQTSFGLATALGITKQEAQQFIDNYFSRFPRVKAYIESTIALAHEQGYVTTMLGRRRYIPELRTSNLPRRNRAEREAVNTTIQGSAADLIKIAMVRVHRAIAETRRDLPMLLQIHDELVFECPQDQADDARAFVSAIMTGAMQLDVPLKVSASYGKNWQEVKG